MAATTTFCLTGLRTEGVTMHASAEPDREETGTGSKDATPASANVTPVRSRRADHRFGQYELKFLVGEETAAQVMDWARLHMARDPVAQCDEHELYHVHSVYLDTPALGVFGRAGALRTRKYRLRRYGNENTIWLERKAKVRGRVKKRRTAVSEEEVACLYDQTPPPGWAGHWFRRRVALRQLQPVCSVTYERFARVGLTPEGPIRLTLDRAIGGCGLRGTEHTTWDVPRDSLATLERLSGLCILELKYPTSLPALFKGVMGDFTLSPLKVSKFRTCMSTWVVPHEENNPEKDEGADESRAVA
jgi:hypothetical protein